MTASGLSSPDATASFEARLTTLSGDPLPPDRADAAVVVLVRPGVSGLEVLAEQRAERPGDPWSGQVGLPGGRRDPLDRSMAETALRELQEEVGFPPTSVVGLPRVFDVRRARPSGLRVAVFVGRYSNSASETSRVDPEEVATTFWLPLDALARTESRTRQTMFGEIQVETVEFEGHVVWGFTLRVLRDFIAWLSAPDSSWPAPPGELQRWRSQAL